VAGRKRTTGRQDQRQQDAENRGGREIGSEEQGARSGEQKQKTEVTRADLNAEKIKGEIANDFKR
jgi:hypothetical protein